MSEYDAVARAAGGLRRCVACGKGKRESEGVRRGFRMVHDRCAAKYDRGARRRAERRTEAFTTTVLPDCRQTEGYFNWVGVTLPRHGGTAGGLFELNAESWVPYQADQDNWA